MDICVANPPYDKKNIEIEFVEHIKKLNCDCYVVLPLNFGFSEKASSLRLELVNTNLIKAIIRMPEKLFKGTSIATDIYVLRKNHLLDIEKFCNENKAIFKQIDKTKILISA